VFGESEFRELVSGRRRGFAASAMRALLRAAEVPYVTAVRWRNWRYDRGKAKIHRADVPVVSVGNLTLGGTGKTPMVEWLARWFHQRHVRTALVSRGYGANADSVNDEALELEQRLPDVPHVQNPNRVEAARTAAEKFQCQLVLLDDAFQHRRIARDLDIVLIDAVEPFGFGHVFPRGTLREPLAGLGRADVVALSRADMADDDQRKAIRCQVLRHAPEAVWIETGHRPRCLLSTELDESPLSSLAGRPVAAFCGIGNPQGFRHTLASCGYQVEAFREFPDHHPYNRDDVQSLIAWSDSFGDAVAVLCTHKDLVKLNVLRLGQKPLRAVSIGLEILAGREALERNLARLAHRARNSDR